MKSSATLDKELKSLVQIVEKQDRHEKAAKKLEESSRRLKWQAVARAYLWWRDADHQSGYLDKIYAAKSIANNSLSNRLNFNPLVRLIWDIHGDRWAHVSSLAKTIAALHEEFLENPQLYKRHAEDELCSFIEDNGGLSGVRRKGSLKFDDDDAIVVEAKPKKPLKDNKLAPNVQKELLKRQTDHIASAAGIATINIGDAAVSTTNSTGSDLLLVLAKRDDKGNMVVIGTSNDRSLVEQAVLDCIDFDQSRLTPILRLLVECLRPHIVPKAFQKRGARDKFFTTHKLRIEEDGKKVDVRESARLVITKTGQVLISKRVSNASLLTISQPKEITIAPDNAIFLRAADRYWLETAHMIDGQIALYSSEPSDALADVLKPFTATKRITLKNELTQSERDIYFYDCDDLDEKLKRQPTIKNHDSIDFDWTLTAGNTFIDSICSNHFNKWMEWVGTRLQVDSNRCFQLVFADDHLEVRSHYQPDSGVTFTRFGEEASSKYGSDASITRNGASCEIIVSPLDMIELFATLRALPLQGAIQIKGNSKLLAISYETATAAHTAYVPACDVKGRRITEHFTRFDPDA